MQRSGRGKQWGTLIAVVSASLVSMGLPDGCNSTGNVGIEPGYYYADVSPKPEDSTFGDPVIVTRDNPGLKGSFWTDAQNVSAAGKCKGSKCDYKNIVKGKWNNVAGWISLTEYKVDQSYVADYKGSFLPIQKQKSPAFMKWASRTFDLIHENTFSATMEGKSGEFDENAIVPDAEKHPFWMRLADDVMLVPVVVVTLRWAKDKTADRTDVAKSLFDFLPYYQPPWMSTSFSSNDIVSPNQAKSIIAPNLYEIPPDDILSQCKIQLQMLASYVFDMDAEGWQPSCSPGAFTAFFVGQAMLEARIAATDSISQYIVDTLKPIYVVYSSDCQTFQGPIGKQTGDRLVEVIYPKAAGKPITAHEVGHVLFGAAHVDDNTNLMRQYPSVDGTSLTQAQCEMGHNRASQFSQRYRDFNVYTGRVRGATVTFGDVDFFAAPPADKRGFKLAPSCCGLKRGGGYVYTTKFDCSARKGKVVKDVHCSECCLGNIDVKMEIIDECAPEDIVEKAMCDHICCDSVGAVGPTVTRYRCEVTDQSHEIQCDLKPK